MDEIIVNHIVETVRWYHKRLSPSLSVHEKEELLHQLIDYRMTRHKGPEILKTSQFPLIDKYLDRDEVSSLELAFIGGELYEDLKEQGAFS